MQLKSETSHSQQCNKAYIYSKNRIFGYFGYFLSVIGFFRFSQHRRRFRIRFS
jgi:hypothetical protein